MMIHVFIIESTTYRASNDSSFWGFNDVESNVCIYIYEKENYVHPLAFSENYNSTLNQYWTR